MKLKEFEKSLKFSFFPHSFILLVFFLIFFFSLMNTIFLDCLVYQSLTFQLNYQWLTIQKFKKLGISVKIPSILEHTLTHRQVLNIQEAQSHPLGL